MDLHRESILNQTQVSLSLTKHVISAHGKDSNLVISPLSIQVLLGLIANGSNGPTRDQLLGFLKAKSTEELNSLSSELATHVLADGEPLRGPHLSFANGVWVDQSLTFKPAFRKITEISYKAAANRVDFRTKAVEVTKEVNAWAEEKTNGLIEEILSPGSLDATTMLIFTNAVYFKGTWKEIFNEYLTKNGEFYPLNGSSIKVPFMSNYKKQYARAFDGFKVLRLPYKKGNDQRREFSMYIYLPDAKDGVLDLLEKAVSEPGFIERHIPDRLVISELRIPKFKIDFKFEASDVLKGLGVTLPFASGGLTEMVGPAVDGKSLYVSRMFQKAFI